MPSIKDRDFESISIFRQYRWKILYCDIFPADKTHNTFPTINIIMTLFLPLRSRGPSQPRDRTQISYSAGRFFTVWATRVKSESESCSVLSHSLWPHGLYSPWNSPVQNTGVGSLSLLQGVFLTQESNQGLLHCRQILHQSTRQGVNPLSYHLCAE